MNCPCEKCITLAICRTRDVAEAISVCKPLLHYLCADINVPLDDVTQEIIDMMTRRMANTVNSLNINESGVRRMSKFLHKLDTELKRRNESNPL